MRARGCPSVRGKRWRWLQYKTVRSDGAQKVAALAYARLIIRLLD